MLPYGELPYGELIQDATLGAAFTVSNKPPVSLTQGSDLLFEYMYVKL